MRAIVSTVSTGNLPTALSPESITASVPSRIALATSEASARVGRGFSIMLSSICVAVITTLPAAFAAAMIRFCAIGTSSVPSSTPRSPRATITPSVTARIASRSSSACGFSIFAITGVCGAAASGSAALASITSAARRTNDIAT